MTRPRSGDKRNAILAAATDIIAEQGVSAPTAKIARAAGVADGSLFTNFPDKDDLLNQPRPDASSSEPVMSGTVISTGAFLSQPSAGQWPGSVYRTVLRRKAGWPVWRGSTMPLP
jgi:hypothetical protein